MYSVFIVGQLHPLGIDKEYDSGVIISEMMFANRRDAEDLLAKAKKEPEYKNEKLYIREVDPRQAELNGWVNVRWPPVCRL